MIIFELFSPLFYKSLVRSGLPVLFWLFPVFTHAQTALIEGRVTDSQQRPLAFVNLALAGTSTGTSTDESGYFQLRVPANQAIELAVSYLGYAPTTVPLTLERDERRQIVISLEPIATPLPDVEVRERQVLNTDITRLDPKLIQLLPGPSASVEALVRTLPGVSSTTELSTQYSVRGGNFDENLVYVNGIEIYRPFLVRSGQQEGLSFLNSNLVESISFSAGGFDARYGDKMSSVLDIQYREPEQFAGSFSVSLLEGSLHLEGRSKNQKFSYLSGFRYKSNQYLLGTLDAQGDYQPSFSDMQGLFAYRFTPDTQLELLLNFSNNRYLFTPEIQVTRFGTVEDVRQLTVYFDGQEVDRFVTATGALSLSHRPNDDLDLRLTASLFQSDEREHFDIIGQYWIQRIEADISEDDFGQVTGTPLGVGTFHNHARNYLNAIVWNLEHRGRYNPDETDLKWGLKFQRENIYDRLREWSLIDSAGYIVPRHPGSAIFLQDTLKATIRLNSGRISGFAEHTWNIDREHGRFVLTAGIRAHFWSFNRQLTVSPRSTLQYKPLAAPRWVFRASAGMYHQHPFYRELRDFNGVLNAEIRAQESIHFVLGADYHFTAWDRPFKYTAELYYKHLNHLIPYELDNVRIRYYAENLARGYAAGLDMKIHGEFVPGVDSWMSLSLMDTREKIRGAFYTDSEGNQTPAGYIPRPTDQRLNVNIFFQDFLPRNPSYKVQLAFVFGTGLPFGPPTLERQLDTLRMPAYKRVDIGFSKQLIGPDSRLSESSPFRHLQSAWVTAEVFNLLEINNTISYLWIKDVENRMLAIPNYLTSRLINVKLMISF